MDCSNGRTHSPTRRQRFKFHIALLLTALVVLATMLVSSPAAAQSNDATLSTLTTNPPFALSPALTPGITAYTVSTHTNVEQIDITARPTDDQAQVTVSGPGAQVGGVWRAPLDHGTNTFIIEVTAADGITTRTYTLNVVRTHDPQRLADGTVGVAYAARLACTAVLTSGSLPPGLTISQTGARTMVSDIPERAGTYFFSCQGSSGSSIFYTILIHPAPASTDAALSGLATSAGPLDPVFSQGITHYAISVPAATGTITVTPTTSDSAATVTVNGIATPSGVASAPIALSVGSNTITVVSTAEDGIATATYTIVVTRGAPNSVSLSPAGGALPEAMAGESYSMPLSATGASPIVFSVTEGTLPEGMQLNASTGELTGPLAEGSEGQYTFSIEARGSDSGSITASFTLTVVERAITVSDKTVDVPAGSTPPNVNLTQGATGGPFTSAVVVSVEPANAGTAEIVDAPPTQARHEKTAQTHSPASQEASDSALYLKFVPNAAYSGRATVKFQLTSDLGASNVGSVIYNLSYDTAAVARKIDGHVRSFVQRRMSLLASNIGAPDLLDRRRVNDGAEAASGTIQPGAGELAVGFSTDLAQARRSRGDGTAAPLPFNLWMDGTLLAHNRDENGERWGTFGLFSGGLDYLVSDRALLGVSFHLDHMRDPTEEDVTLTGRGWLAGPYGSFEIVQDLFFNVHLLQGRSSNDVDSAFFDGRFDSRRWLLDTSLAGQWRFDELTTLTPRLRALYFDETVRDYRVSNQSGSIIAMPGFAQKQLRVSFGADLERRIELNNGLTLIPNAGLTGGFAGLDGSGAFGSVVAGVTLSNRDLWTTEAGVRFDMEGDGQIATGGRVGFSMRCVCH